MFYFVFVDQGVYCGDFDVKQCFDCGFDFWFGCIVGDFEDNFVFF